MKKMKLLTSLSACLLLLTLGACDEVTQEDSPDEGSETTETTETTDSGEPSEGGDTGTTDTDLEGYALVGAFADSSWDSKPSEGSKYYIPLGTTEYKVTVTMDEDPNEGYDAKFRIVEWGDSWNLVAGYDELAEGSTGVTGEGDDKNIAVTWGATYDLVITLGENPSILVTLQTEEGGDEDGNENATLLGSFDFSNNQATSGTVISSNDALDEFWTGDEGLYIEARQHDTVYLGNGSGGAYANSKTCIKFGVSGTDGYLQLKFAVGITIDKVVVSACSFSSGETDQLKINGISQDTSSTGVAAELTYEFEDEYNYLLDFEATGRVTIHAIDIYGTYTPDDVTPITELTLTPSTSDAINVGESLDVAVSYAPTDTVFDTDTLTWTSNAESVATAEVSLTGGKVIGVGSGEATITATAENGVYASLTITIQDVLEESETFTIQGLGYSGSTFETNTLYGHQVNMTVAKGTGNNNPQWDANLVRTYANNTITFNPTYEEKGATISKIEIVCNGTYFGNDAAEFTDASGNVAGTISNPKTSGCTITITVTATGAVTFTNWLNAQHTGTSGGTQLRFTSVTVYYNLAA